MGKLDFIYKLSASTDLTSIKIIENQTFLNSKNVLDSLVQFFYYTVYMVFSMQFFSGCLKGMSRKLSFIALKRLRVRING